MVKQKRDLQEISSELEPLVVERATSDDNTRTILREIKNCEGVIGYIYRNSTSAAIDLNDPNKLMDYAILSSSAFETSEKLSELLDLGKAKNIIVEGRDAKVVHMSIGESNISIFMEKNTDTRKILDRMHSQ